LSTITCWPKAAVEGKTRDAARDFDQLLSDDPSDDVGAAACGKRHDDAHGLDWIVLGVNRRNDECGEHGDGDDSNLWHFFSGR